MAPRPRHPPWAASRAPTRTPGRAAGELRERRKGRHRPEHSRLPDRRARNASVWTRYAHAGRAVAARLKAGTVNVNEGFAATFGSAGAPMGGMKESGVGRRNGAEGLLRYTKSQTVAVQRGLRLRPVRDNAPAELWTRGMTGSIKALRRLPRRS